MTRHKIENPDLTQKSRGSGSSKKKRTDAIVGGVVGGIAALAVLCLAALFYRRRKRLQQGIDAPATSIDIPLGNLSFAHAHTTSNLTSK